MISCKARQEALSILRGRDGCATNRNLSPGVRKIWIKPSAIRSCPWPSITCLWQHAGLPWRLSQWRARWTVQVWRQQGCNVKAITQQTSKMQGADLVSQLLCEMAIDASYSSSAAAFFWCLNRYRIKRSTENGHCRLNELKSLHYHAVFEHTSSPPLKRLSWFNPAAGS